MSHVNEIDQGQWPSVHAEAVRSSLSSTIPTRLAVIFATDFERTSFGGITTGLKELARHLSDRFRLVIVGVGHGDLGKPIHKQEDGIELTLLPVVSPRRRLNRVPLNLVFVARLFLMKRRIEQQADLILPRRVESALPFVVGKTKPVVLTIHGSSKHLDFVRTGFLRWKIVQMLYRIVEGFVLSRVDHAVLVGQAGYQFYLARYPKFRQKFLLIPNCINVSEFSAIDRNVARSQLGFKESDLVITYIGRLSAEKQIPLLIETFARLSRTRANAHLLIAGDGAEKQSLQAQVARLGLTNVRFLGWLTREEIRTLLSGADVFVLLSLFEGFSNAVLEALACGVPVVTTDVGGMRELLAHDLHRFIVPSADPDLIKDRILEAADSREALAGTCVAQAKRYDVQQIIPQLEGLYSVLAGAWSNDTGSGRY